MTNYANWKIKKSELDEKLDEYSQVAEWCNDSGEYTITEDSRYYKVAPIEISLGDQKDFVRSIRNQYLLDTDFTQLPDSPFTSEEKAQYAGYREYLRGYTDNPNWWLKNPYDFESWINSAKPVEE